MSRPVDPGRIAIPGFRLQRRLGQGGMGTAWDAIVVRSRRALRAGQHVVIKVLHPHLATDPERVHDFKREAGIGLAIEHHHLVRVHSLGVVRTALGSTPYLVMDPVAGRSLASWVGRDLRESEVRRIGRQIASALAALHARRLIHRDLKPDNVFIDDAGHVTVVDYGLSVLIDESSKGPAEETFAGTLAYAAPERLHGGGRPGPATDLFSLGVILYELATGRHPFRSEGDDPAALIHSIQTHQPAPPSRQRAALSHLFDSLVQELLEKDPGDRLSSAALVEQVLREGESSRWWRRHVRVTRADVAAGKRVLAVDRRTRMCGRDAALDQLMQGAQAVFQGHGKRVVLISGEAGTGKSRLIAELAERMDREGFRGFFLVGRAFSTNVPLPYETAIELVERALDVRGLDDGPREERLTGGLEELLQIDRADAAEAARFLVARARTEWSPQRAVALFRRIFQALATIAPGVFVFEGVDRAAEGTLDLIEGLAREPSHERILLIATARPPGTGGRLARRFDRLTATLRERTDGGCLRLGPLEGPDVALMLRDLGMNVGPTSSLGRRMIELGGGNPESILLMARIVEREGAAAIGLGEEGDRGSAPDQPLDIQWHRLVDLEDRERRYLEVSAIQGVRFDPRVTAQMLGLNPPDADHLLAGLEGDRGLVCRTEHGARFVRSRTRTLVLESVDVEILRGDHQAMAAWLASRDTGEGLGGRRALRGLVHALAARDARLVGRMVVEAVGHLALRQLPERAVRLIDAALRLADEVRRTGPDGLAASRMVDRPAVHMLHAGLLGRLGDRRRESEALTRALRCAVSLGDSAAQAAAEIGLARLHLATGRYLAGLSACLAAEARLRRLDDPAGAARVLGIRADLLSHLGDERVARRVVNEALEQDERAGERPGRGRVLADLGRVLAELSIGDETLPILRRALDHALEDADAELETEIRFYLALVHRDEAAYEEGMREARRALAGARRVRNRFLEGRSLFLAGSILLRAGRPDQALVAFERALPLAVRVEDLFLQVYLLADVATAYLDPRCRRRDAAQAADRARQAIARAADLDLGRERLLGHAVLAQAYLAQGKVRWAASIVAKSARTVDLVDLAWRRAAQIHLAGYEVMRAQGAEMEAEGALRRAHRIVREAVRQRRDRRVRERLARRDPVFRKVLEAWAARRR